MNKEKKRKLFTVCIPVYNKKEYLTNTIKSLEEQTYKNFNVLFIDDYSTDGSFEMLQNIDSNIDIDLIRNPQNLGLSQTRNQLIDNATGKYIVFLDSDDTIDKNLLSELAPYTEQNVDIIRYNINVQNDDPNKDLSRFNYPKSPEIMSGIDAFKYFSKFPNKRYALACSMALKKDFLKTNNIKFPSDLRIHEDIATLPIALGYANKVAITDFVGYNYFKNPHSLTRSESLITDPDKKLEKLKYKQNQFALAINYALTGLSEIPYNISPKGSFKYVVKDLLKRYIDNQKSFFEKAELLRKEKNFKNKGESYEI